MICHIPTYALVITVRVSVSTYCCSWIPYGIHKLIRGCPRKTIRHNLNCHLPPTMALCEFADMCTPLAQRFDYLIEVIIVQLNWCVKANNSSRHLWPTEKIPYCQRTLADSLHMAIHMPYIILSLNILGLTPTTPLKFLEK